MVIFHSYVSLPEGIHQKTWLSEKRNPPSHEPSFGVGICPPLVGMMKFPIEWIKFMFQTTNQIIYSSLLNPLTVISPSNSIQNPFKSRHQNQNLYRGYWSLWLGFTASIFQTPCRRLSVAEAPIGGLGVARLGRTHQWHSHSDFEITPITMVYGCLWYL